MAGSVSFTIDAEDYYQAQRSHHLRLLRAPQLWRRIALYALAAIVLVALFVTMVNDGDWRIGLVTAAGAVIGGAAMGALFYAIGFAMLRRRSDRLFGQHASIRQPFASTWDDTGDRWDGTDTQSRTRWHDYVGWHESEATVLLYLNDLLFQVVPKRAFAEAALADLRATLVAHGPPRR